LVLCIWFFPEKLSIATRSQNAVSASFFRWIILYLTLIPLAFIISVKYSRLRGTVSAFYILSVFLLGWLTGKWFGIFLITVPLLILLLYLIYRCAQIVIPASIPRDNDLSFLEFIIYPFSRKATGSSNINISNNNWKTIVLIAFQLFTILLFSIFQNTIILVLYGIARLLIAILQVLEAGDKVEKKGEITDPVPAMQEQWQKFQAYLSYLLGFQYPFWVVKGSASRDIDMRIPGNFYKNYGGPGIVWMRPHQAVGMSMGIEFIQVDGPGTIFSKRYERPIAAVDLRTQLRLTDVKAVTRNGMPVTLSVFSSFTIDREDWPSEHVSLADMDRLRQANSLLQGGEKLNKRYGSFPYSTTRTQAVLSTVGIDTDLNKGDKIIYWDEWVVRQIEHAARQIVSERSLDELWKPKVDKLNASASDEMAERLMQLLYQKLGGVGICLYGAWIVDYKFDNGDKIPNQQVDTWQTYWSQRVTAEKTAAEAQRNEDVEKAHAYAKSVFLDAIGDSMDKAIDPNNPRLLPNVIALYFIHAIENYIRRFPTDVEHKQYLETVKQLLMSSGMEEK
jgi:hypothetical protein